MDKDVSTVLERLRNKRKNYVVNNKVTKNNSSNKKIKYFKNLLTRILISTIIMLLTIILINKSSTFKGLIKDNVYSNTINFAEINSLYAKYLGGIIPFDKIGGTSMVFNDSDINEYKEYNDGYIIKSNTNVVTNIHSGIVVFIGKKDNYNDTVIVQGSDGVDIWYGNLSNINVTLYDYIESNTIIGENIDNSYYLVIQKDGKYLEYEEYFKED